MYSTIAIIALIASVVSAGADLAGSLGNRRRFLLTLGIVVPAIVAVVLCLLRPVRSVTTSDNVPWALAIHKVDVPVIIYSADMKILDINTLAASFYVRERRELLGKEPSSLNEFIRPYLSNWSEWAAEQTTRLALAKDGRLDSRTRTPMMLTNEHPFGEGRWYITSHPITVDNVAYYVTHFTHEPTTPRPSNMDD